MVNKIKILVILLLICIICTVNIYADNTNVWNGYSIYNLNNAAIEVDSETRGCTIYGSRISSVTNYTIKNSSTNEVTAVLGLPVNEIDSISVKDGSKALKLRQRSLDNVRDAYKIDGQLPVSDVWYFFDLHLKAGESRTIQLKTEEILLKDSGDVYNLAFFKDKDNTRVLTGKTIQFKAEFSDYKPYNIVDIDGLQYGDIDDKGIINLNMKGDAAPGFTIKYQPVEKMILDKLSQSVYKKPKAIANAYRSRDYNTALTLCNEYINLPQDKKLNTDQIRFVKAECLRQQKKSIEYIDAVNGLNVISLFPARTKYKILFDKLNIYKSLNKEAEYQQLLTQVNNDTKENYEFLNSWLKNNGYVVNADSSSTGGNTETSEKPNDTVKKAGWLSTYSAKLVTLVKSIRKDIVIAVVVSFILGFLIGRRGGGKNGGRRRRKDTVYFFRN